MLELTERIAEENEWWDSKGIRSLVYYLAQRYASSSQVDKDAIALYFVDTSGRYSGELAGGDDDEAEQNAIDFVKECLGDQWQ
jgi:hypothetical protein